jgi:hypothetical protein
LNTPKVENGMLREWIKTYPYRPYSSRKKG